MIRLIHHSARIAKLTQRKNLGKNRDLAIFKDENGIITVRAGKYSEFIDTKELNSWEIIEAVRWAILRSGFVFSRQIEKMARRNLNL